VATEAEYLAILAKTFASAIPALRVGIGDDAAVVDVSDVSIALSTDMAIEGTHFNRDWSTPYEIGRKITAANLADIFAMGGKPQYLLVAAAIPVDTTSHDVAELARGIRDEAAKVGAVVVGGDLAKSPLLTIAISAFGGINKPILRSGARIGDVVAISDLPGESSRGLELLVQGIRDDRTLEHRHPTVNYEKVLGIKANSLTDNSDGLIAELESLSKASKVLLEISSKNLPVDFHTLHGGEDHVFVGTFEKCPAAWIEIGRVVAGSGVSLDGDPIVSQGFKHF
jgi:thiamine-monophosphate kinase